MKDPEKNGRGDDKVTLDEHEDKLNQEAESAPEDETTLGPENHETTNSDRESLASYVSCQEEIGVVSSTQEQAVINDQETEPISAAETTVGLKGYEKPNSRRESRASFVYDEEIDVVSPTQEQFVIHSHETEPISKAETAIGPEEHEKTNSGRESQASYVYDEEIGVVSPAQEEAAQGPKIVPTAQRRGWLARLVLVPEVKEPKDYGRPTKWLITAIIAFGAMAAPLGSSIIFRKTAHNP